jgi:hypothetical protein
MKRMGYSEEMIKATIETLDEDVTWKELREGQMKYEAMISAKRKALTWRAIQKSDKTWELRDIQNYQKELDKTLKSIREYAGYQHLLEENAIDQETINGYFNDAQKSDSFFGKKKTISPSKQHKESDESIQRIRQKNKQGITPGTYEQLRINK